MKSNIHKKYTKEDKFGRRFYCQNARLAQLRSEKKQQRKTFRKLIKKSISKLILLVDKDH